MSLVIFPPPNENGKSLGCEYPIFGPNVNK